MYADVPRQILDMLKGEPVDFIVRSAQDYRKRALGYVILGITLPFSWLIVFPLPFAWPFFEVIYSGKTTITVNGELTTYTMSNILMPFLFMLFPAGISLLFTVPGIILFFKAIKFIRKKGPWYAGTNTHLIEINSQNSRHFSWNQFESRINTKKHKDNSLDVILFLKKPEVEVNLNQTNSNQGVNINISVDGKAVHPADLSEQIPIFNNRIGMLRIPNGEYVLNMIRHNMNKISGNIGA